MNQWNMYLVREMLSRSLLGTALCFVFLVPTNLTAQTPDGFPPSNEGVCDGLKIAGVTRGLYGLCVAFCEAQDCEPDLSAADPFSACLPSSGKLLAKYNKRKGAGDPDMPCIQGPCPCWTQGELSSLRQPLPGDDTVCFSHLGNLLFTIFEPNNLDYDVVVSVQPSFSFCFFEDICTPAGGPCLGVRRFFEATPEELATCQAQAAQTGADRGFSCFLP